MRGGILGLRVVAGPRRLSMTQVPCVGPFEEAIWQTGFGLTHPHRSCFSLRSMICGVGDTPISEETVSYRAASIR
jgi:hypothetical protein